MKGVPKTKPVYDKAYKSYCAECNAIVYVVKSKQFKTDNLCEKCRKKLYGKKARYRENVNEIDEVDFMDLDNQGVI